MDRQACHQAEEVVCKLPHLDGLEGLSCVLAEAAVLMTIQERVQSEIALQHLVKFVGFCLELPTVAVLLQYCNGGTLLHRLSLAQHSSHTSADYRSNRYVTHRRTGLCELDP